MNILSVIQAAAGLYVLYRCLLALNSMNRHTRWPVRFAYVALGGGACAAVVSCMVMRDVFECIFAVGVAIYFACDRRKAYDFH